MSYFTWLKLNSNSTLVFNGYGTTTGGQGVCDTFADTGLLSFAGSGKATIEINASGSYGSSWKAGVPYPLIGDIDDPYYNTTTGQVNYADGTIDLSKFILEAMPGQSLPTGSYLEFIQDPNAAYQNYKGTGLSFVDLCFVPGANIGAGMQGGVQIVPEPSTLALLAAGVIGFLMYAWRKRRAA